MRVISGKFKGRRLVSFAADHIRPTTDRVKETLFNKLMGRIEGARVLDLFSGTGNLAIECLSRGAAWVDLVEKQRRSLEIIRQNLATLKIQTGFKIHPQDAFAYIADYAGPAYDLVLVDPPFTEAWAHTLAGQLGQCAGLGAGAWIVIEASAKERMDVHYPGLNHLDQRKFGDKNLNFFEKVNHGQGDLPR